MPEYCVILPMDAAISVSFGSDQELSREDAIKMAYDVVGLARLEFVMDADADHDGVAEIDKWQVHCSPVNRGNVCKFLQSEPVVDRL
jgi:hypothetical protein